MLLFRRCLAELIQLAGAEAPEPSLDDCAWAGHARHRLRAVLRERLANPDWFESLMRAAIYDPDPSFCRAFVEPALAAYGRRSVQEFLIRTLRDGTDTERAGAAQAWYWSLLTADGTGSRWTAPPVAPVDDDAVRQRWIEWTELALQVFVSNDHLGVRCRILPQLTLDVKRYRAELHPLVNEAIHIARTSKNAYLRHRVEAQIKAI